MNTMYIGSGDTGALFSGINTETHYKLLRRFVSGVKPYYNAKNSPIDALRTGAILEDRFFLQLPENYYSQYTVANPEQDVLRCTLDFALIEGGNVKHFKELKTCNFDDFLAFEKYRDDPESGVEFVRKHYKNNYNQVQFQLYCTGLQSATLVFLAVYGYDDSENILRNIQPNEYIEFTIERDECVIENIKRRAVIFQTIKDFYTKP